MSWELPLILWNIWPIDWFGCFLQVYPTIQYQFAPRRQQDVAIMMGCVQFQQFPLCIINLDVIVALWYHTICWFTRTWPIFFIWIFQMQKFSLGSEGALQSHQSIWRYLGLSQSFSAFAEVWHDWIDQDFWQLEASIIVEMKKLCYLSMVVIFFTRNTIATQSSLY